MQNSPDIFSEIVNLLSKVYILKGDFQSLTEFKELGYNIYNCQQFHDFSYRELQIDILISFPAVCLCSIWYNINTEPSL